MCHGFLALNCIHYCYIREETATFSLEAMCEYACFEDSGLEIPGVVGSWRPKIPESIAMGMVYNSAPLNKILIMTGEAITARPCIPGKANLLSVNIWRLPG